MPTRPLGTKKPTSLWAALSKLHTIDLKIRNAWGAAVVSGVMSLIFLLASFVADKTGRAGFDTLDLIDISMFFILAIGIYLRSRTAAVAMFFYFLATKLVLWSTPEGMNGGWVLFDLLFLYFFFEGIRGTLAFHREKNPDPANP